MSEAKGRLSVRLIWKFRVRFSVEHSINDLAAILYNYNEKSLEDPHQQESSKKWKKLFIRSTVACLMNIN